MDWRRGPAACGLLFLSALAGAPACAADAIADFYAGKNVQILVGASVGGGYDLVARMIASRLGRFIPGNPKIVVQNMPAAGGLSMANNLYNLAPRDGTVIGLPTNAVALEPRLKILSRAGGVANFDVTKFNWLGSAARLPQILYAWHKADVRTAADLKTRKLIVAALAVGSDSYILPTVMNKLLGAQMQIVSGYEGHADTSVALERGEAQGYNNSYAGLIGNKPDWVRDKLVHILIQFGRERLPQLPDVPTAIELASAPLDKAALGFYASKYDLAYTLITPPGVPAERVGALRLAFDATMRDPEYQAAATRLQIPLNALDGDAATTIIQSIQAAPEEVVDHMRDLMTPRSGG